MEILYTRDRLRREAEAAAERAGVQVDPEVARMELLAANARRHIAEAKQRADHERALQRGQELIEEVLSVAGAGEHDETIRRVRANPNFTEEQKLGLDGTGAAYSETLEALRLELNPPRQPNGQFRRRR